MMQQARLGYRKSWRSGLAARPRSRWLATWLFAAPAALGVDSPAHGRLPPDRRARRDRRPAHGGARRHRRDYRLVLLPAVRLAERLRRDPRRREGRSLSDLARRREMGGEAALLAGHERPDHALPDPGRR